MGVTILIQIVKSDTQEFPIDLWTVSIDLPIIVQPKPLMKKAGHLVTLTTSDYSWCRQHLSTSFLLVPIQQLDEELQIDKFLTKGHWCCRGIRTANNVIHILMHIYQHPHYVLIIQGFTSIKLVIIFAQKLSLIAWLQRIICQWSMLCRPIPDSDTTFTHTFW